MGSALPEIPEEEFRRRLATSAPASPSLASSLYAHYRELRRWNPRVSLVGPGDAAEIVERHYGESLAGLELLEPGDRTLVDVGSGAGFPGMILAAARSAAGPPLEVTLIEPREKKWLFLKAASRRLGLSSRCLDARVDRVLPAGIPDTIDVVTCRALAVVPRLFELFFEHSPRTRFLLWYGEGEPDLPQHLPGSPGLALAVTREVPLAGERRRILEIRATRSIET